MSWTTEDNTTNTWSAESSSAVSWDSNSSDTASWVEDAGLDGTIPFNSIFTYNTPLFQYNGQLIATPGFESEADLTTSWVEG